MHITARTGDGLGKQIGLSRFLSIAWRLPGYDLAWLKVDLVAGLTVWALTAPTSIGYASLRSVPVPYGLYAAAVGLVVITLFTTS